MASTTNDSEQFRGPHEGRELELMISGAKPLAMFVEPIPRETAFFPEPDFDAWVTEGRFIKQERIETVRHANGSTAQVRRVLYATAQEGWRIKAVLLIEDLYQSLLPGWRPDLDRAIGLLLGYDRQDIERFLNSLR
jgi:hypothetical protein